MAILGPLAAHGARRATTLVSRYDGWRGVGGARAAPPFGPNAVDYFVSEAAHAFFRLRQPTDDRPLAAAVSPGLAALANDDGLLAVQLPAGTVTLRVVGDGAPLPERARAGRRRRSRRAGGRAAGAPARRRHRERALARHAVARGGREARSRRRRSTCSQVESRAGLRHTLDADPLTRGTILLLLAAMGIALLLGLLAVFFLAETDVRDGRGELLDLETQGAEPRALRRHLRLRLLLVAVPGIVGGAVAGLLLSRLVVRFVELTLTARRAGAAARAQRRLGPARGRAGGVPRRRAPSIAVLRSRSAFRTGLRRGRAPMTSRSRPTTSSTSTRARRATPRRSRG